VIAPKHNKARTVPMSPCVAAALAALPRRGLWVIAADDGQPVDYDRAGGMLEAITGLYAPRPNSSVRSATASTRWSTS
jgi:hypothetical protein